MTEPLGRTAARRRTGAEAFHEGGKPLGFALLDFWQWSASDLLDNTARGRLAEYLVALAIGLPRDAVRDEWAVYDLTTPSGIKVEVKSAAYLQSLHQREPSRIVFVTPTTRTWEPDTNQMAADARRQADVYVFALLAHQEKTTIDPLDIAQWKFYVLPTSALDKRVRSQHSITLKSLDTMCNGCVPYAQLGNAIELAGAVARSA